MKRHHDRLLEQAALLVRLEARRPRQASLRRAVSTAYYALFHCLVQDCTIEFLGTRGSDRPLRNALARSFDHGTMRDVSQRFSTYPPAVPRALGSCLPTPARFGSDLTSVARSFARLQERRHVADYDLSARFTRREALHAIELADHAMRTWKRIRRSDEARVYRLALPSWRGLRGR